MKEINFKIGETDFIIKQTFRSLLMFEEMTGNEYKKDDKLSTQLIMLYCILKSANKNTFKYEYDEFVDVLDENQDSVEKFFGYLNSMLPKEDGEDKKKVNPSE